MSEKPIRRFCPYCGEATAPNWQHCPACGKPLNELVDPREIAHPGEDRWSEAVTKIKLGELDQAYQYLSDLLQSDPDDAQILAMLGAVCLHQRHIEEAQDYLNKAVKLAPTTPFIRLKLAEYWLALGIPSRALEQLDKAEELAEGNIHLLIQIRMYKKRLREQSRGNVLLQPPPPPSVGFFNLFQKHKNVTPSMEIKGGSSEL